MAIANFNGEHREKALSRASAATLLFVFAALQLADVLTTNYALSGSGIWEANPLVHLLQRDLGGAWWLPKLAPVALAFVVVLRMRRSWPMVVAISYYALTVCDNLRYL